MPFNVGDVVQLKSGGPSMTVQRIIGSGNTPPTKIQDVGFKQAGYIDGDVVCQWFLNNKLESGAFHAIMLDSDDEE